MKPEESFVGQPIRSLQTMLRTIRKIRPEQPAVVPDGIYTQQTRDAVAAFQRRKGLPVTGTADNATWDAIVKEFRLARIETEPAQPVRIVLDPGEVLRAGTESPYIYLLQSLLTVLALSYEAIPMPEHTGVMDGPTRAAVTAFQTAADLPPTGNVDKTTWKHLALQYAQAAAAPEE